MLYFSQTLKTPGQYSKCSTYNRYQYRKIKRLKGHSDAIGAALCILPVPVMNLLIDIIQAGSYRRLARQPLFYYCAFRQPA